MKEDYSIRLDCENTFGISVNETGEYVYERKKIDRKKIYSGVKKNFTKAEIDKINFCRGKYSEDMNDTELIVTKLVDLLNVVYLGLKLEGYDFNKHATKIREIMGLENE